jgi:hypothetical protein
MFRNITLKCLTEIAAVTVPHYDEIFVSLFTETMAQLEQMLPVETNVKEAYANGMDAEQQFIQVRGIVIQIVGGKSTSLTAQLLFAISTVN